MAPRSINGRKPPAPKVFTLPSTATAEDAQRFADRLELADFMAEHARDIIRSGATSMDRETLFRSITEREAELRRLPSGNSNFVFDL